MNTKFTFDSFHKISGRGTVFAGQAERGSINVGMYLQVGGVALSIRGVEYSSHGNDYGLVFRPSEVDSSGVLSPGRLVKGREYDVLRYLEDAVKGDLLCVDCLDRGLPDSGTFFSKCEKCGCPWHICNTCGTGVAEPHDQALQGIFSLMEEAAGCGGDSVKISEISSVMKQWGIIGEQ